MNNQQPGISYTVVEELFKLLNEQVSRWSNRRRDAGINIQVRLAAEAEQKNRQGNLRKLKPELRNR
jgi:hypothetical protein